MLKIHTGETKIDPRVECGASIHAIFKPTVRRSQIFFAQNILHPKGNHRSKFQLAGVCRFGGLREQINKQTFSPKDWCFYRVNKNIPH